MNREMLIARLEAMSRVCLNEAAKLAKGEELADGELVAEWNLLIRAVDECIEEPA